MAMLSPKWSAGVQSVLEQWKVAAVVGPPLITAFALVVWQAGKPGERVAAAALGAAQMFLRYAPQMIACRYNRTGIGPDSYLSRPRWQASSRRRSVVRLSFIEASTQFHSPCGSLPLSHPILRTCSNSPTAQGGFAPSWLRNPPVMNPRPQRPT